MEKPGLKEIRSTVKSIDYIVTSFGPPSTISNQDYMYNIYQNITSIIQVHWTVLTSWNSSKLCSRTQKDKGLQPVQADCSISL